MSTKLPTTVVRQAMAEVLQESKEKKRNFVETIELQIGLKNYDTKKDKRFAGTVKLPHNPRPRMKIAILADAAHKSTAEGFNLPVYDVDALKKFNKQKKPIKKFAKSYDAFLASESIIKMIPRILGPGLNKAGKFPSLLAGGEDMLGKVEELQSTVKFQLKKVLCLSTAVGNVEMSEDECVQNTILAVNFLVSLLKKHWQNVKSLHIKSTMGKPKRLY
uniref:Ribosomal protein n=1 Tax=Erythrolobus australicus TaxID=1077150 RepID=A0A7S1XI30_9RHOD|mmetsp:Transcript_1479/g.3942  ORF Transcript_1479/g.3942 Transcript_1479/m.3942 type:complete len:218 (+) Transcript_1479:73-726(+)|eukprot:CAMPEP_0185832932 /NCGR_PEP_ID=MMETSP1353-20130828/2378_1 /TAXON_ID=1077150 /ORGANISM="Erythrolobus australicus, Strain CCMP3124" /LENGTH=217 /DNA_ID=CAMNT_0028531169 /DNA_START=70 /DNA_END=723 /DNA_ORIENTATION=+